MTSEFTNYANVFHSYFPPFQIVCIYFIYQLHFIVVLVCQLSRVVTIFVIIIYWFFFLLLWTAIFIDAYQTYLSFCKTAFL